MIYFKQLKCILIMLAVLTFLSIPQIVILWIQLRHRSLYDITKLNIGVLSQSTIHCQQKDYDQQYNRLNFYCPSGSLLTALEKFEIGEAQDLVCMTVGLDSSMLGHFTPYENCMMDNFDRVGIEFRQTCTGHQQCNFDLGGTKLVSNCVTPPNTIKFNAGSDAFEVPNFTWEQRSQIFISYTCVGTDIHLLHTDKMSRQSFAYFYIVMDAVQMAVSMAFLLWMRAKAIKEVN